MYIPSEQFSVLKVFLCFCLDVMICSALLTYPVCWDNYQAHRDCCLICTSPVMSRNCRYYFIWSWNEVFPEIMFVHCGYWESGIYWPFLPHCLVWNVGKRWFICRDIIYLDTFNGASCGFSAMVYFPKLWTGNQEVYENLGLYLCQVMSKTWCRGWEAMFVVVTSFNQTLSGCWARSGQMSKLIPGKSHYLSYLKEKEHNRKDALFLKWPHKTIIISIFPDLTVPCSVTEDIWLVLSINSNPKKKLFNFIYP